MPTTYMTGPDVSHWQGTIHWPSVRDAGYRACVIKATEGTGFVDDRYHENIREARDADFLVGAYHFLRSGSIAAQVDNYLNTVGDLTGILPVLDVESQLNYSDIVGWCDEFRRRTNQEPVLYTYNHWWTDNVGSSPVPCPYLWIARYRDHDLGPGPTPPGDYLLIGWQFSSTFSVPGISGNADMNDWYISADHWLSLAGEGLPPGIPDMEELEMPYPVVGVQNDAARPPIVLVAGEAVPVNDEYRSVGASTGVLQPIEWTSARAYDVSKDLVRKLGAGTRTMSQDGVKNVITAYDNDAENDSPLHNIVREATSA